MVQETTATVKFDGWAAVAHLEVQEMRLVFQAGALGEVEKLTADSLPAVGRRDEEFVDPRAFASILQTVIEAQDEIGHGAVGVPRQIDKAVSGIAEKLLQI